MATPVIALGSLQQPGPVRQVVRTVEVEETFQQRPRSLRGLAGNAPHLKADYVERACRGTLFAKATSEALNRQFEAEGLAPFAIRFGIHLGDAVVDN